MNIIFLIFFYFSEKKFNLGDKLKVRVLKVDPTKRRLHLTHKRLLVETDYTMVNEFDEKFINKISEGKEKFVF